MKAWMSYEVSWAMLLKLKPFSCRYGEIYANTLNINELSKPEPICFLKSSADTWKNGVLLTEKKKNFPSSTIMHFNLWRKA